LNERRLQLGVKNEILRNEATGTVDVIVAFEGLEHPAESAEESGLSPAIATQEVVSPLPQNNLVGNRS
jgi:hypothetical protein